MDKKMLVKQLVDCMKQAQSVLDGVLFTGKNPLLDDSKDFVVTLLHLYDVLDKLSDDIKKLKNPNE